MTWGLIDIVNKLRLKQTLMGLKERFETIMKRSCLYQPETQEHSESLSIPLEAPPLVVSELPMPPEIQAPSDTLQEPLVKVEVLTESTATLKPKRKSVKKKTSKKQSK